MPNNSVKLGLKAIVALTSDADTFDGIATFEIVFGGGMSLQQIMFYGKAEIVSPKISAITAKFSKNIADRLNKLPLTKGQVDAQDSQATNNPQNSILASLFLSMNFEDGFELQGTFRCKLMAAQGVITGEGSIDLLLSQP
ncbi:MAG: hypothetical protein AAFX40_02920, partial [Cyanobacteria bacterium J06639_1]